MRFSITFPKAAFDNPAFFVIKAHFTADLVNLAEQNWVFDLTAKASKNVFYEFRHSLHPHMLTYRTIFKTTKLVLSYNVAKYFSGIFMKNVVRLVKKG